MNEKGDRRSMGGGRARRAPQLHIRTEAPETKAIACLDIWRKLMEGKGSVWVDIKGELWRTLGSGRTNQRWNKYKDREKAMHSQPLNKEIW